MAHLRAADDINEYRIHTLETLLAEKDRDVADGKGKLVSSSDVESLRQQVEAEIAKVTALLRQAQDDYRSGRMGQ